MSATSNGSPLGTLVILGGVTTLLSTTLVLLITVFLDSPPPASSIIGSDNDSRLRERLEGLESRVEKLSLKVEEMERRPRVDRAPQEDRSAVPPQGIARNREAPATSARARRESPPDGDRPRDGRRSAEGLTRLMSLRAGGTPAERLSVAREILQDPESSGWWIAVQTLLELEPAEALLALQGRAQQGDSESPRGGSGMWESSFQALARSPDIDVVAELHALYAMGSDSVKGAAARTLQQRGDDSLMAQYLSELQSHLQSSDSKVRMRAIEQIASSRSEQAYEVLVPLLSDANPDIRLRALEGLPRLGSEETIGHLERLAEDPDDRVKRRATRMLEMADMRQRMLEGRRSGQ